MRPSPARPTTKTSYEGARAAAGDVQRQPGDQGQAESGGAEARRRRAASASAPEPPAQRARGEDERRGQRPGRERGPEEDDQRLRRRAPVDPGRLGDQADRERQQRRRARIEGQRHPPMRRPWARRPARRRRAGVGRGSSRSAGVLMHAGSAPQAGRTSGRSADQRSSTAKPAAAAIGRSRRRRPRPRGPVADVARALRAGAAGPASALAGGSSSTRTLPPGRSSAAARRSSRSGRRRCRCCRRAAGPSASPPVVGWSKTEPWITSAPRSRAIVHRAAGRSRPRSRATPRRPQRDEVAADAAADVEHRADGPVEQLFLLVGGASAASGRAAAGAGCRPRRPRAVRRPRAGRGRGRGRPRRRAMALTQVSSRTRLGSSSSDGAGELALGAIAATARASSIRSTSRSAGSRPTRRPSWRSAAAWCTPVSATLIGTPSKASGSRPAQADRPVAAVLGRPSTASVPGAASAASDSLEQPGVDLRACPSRSAGPARRGARRRRRAGAEARPRPAGRARSPPAASRRAAPSSTRVRLAAAGGGHRGERVDAAPPRPGRPPARACRAAEPGLRAPGHGALAMTSRSDKRHSSLSERNDNSITPEQARRDQTRSEVPTTCAAGTAPVNRRPSATSATAAAYRSPLRWSCSESPMMMPSGPRRKQSR